MQDNANDNVPSSDLAGIANPTISEVLAAYLAEEKARLKPDIHLTTNPSRFQSL